MSRLSFLLPLLSLSLLACQAGNSDDLSGQSDTSDLGQDGLPGVFCSASPDIAMVFVESADGLRSDRHIMVGPVEQNPNGTGLYRQVGLGSYIADGVELTIPPSTLYDYSIESETVELNVEATRENSGTLDAVFSYQVDAEELLLNETFSLIRVSSLTDCGIDLDVDQFGAR